MVIEYSQLRSNMNSPSLTEDRFHRDYSLPVFVAFVVIAFGTIVNILSDIFFHPFGVLFACLSVLFNAFYQVSVQEEQASTTYERLRFLQTQTLISAFVLFPFWPFLDETFPFTHIVLAHWDASTLFLLCGFLAFFVNASAVSCVKDDTAIGYNMVGQLKTVFIVFLGSAIYREVIGSAMEQGVSTQSGVDVMQQRDIGW